MLSCRKNFGRTGEHGKHTDGRTGEHGKLFCRFCHCITAGRSRACARAGTAAAGSDCPLFCNRR